MRIVFDMCANLLSLIAALFGTTPETAKAVLLYVAWPAITLTLLFSLSRANKTHDAKQTAR